MIALTLAALLTAQPVPPPPDNQDGECARAVILSWAARVDRLRGRRGKTAQLVALSDAAGKWGPLVRIDPDFIRAIMWTESKGTNKAGKIGERGPYQMIPRYVRSLTEWRRAELIDKMEEADAGTMLFARFLDRIVRKYGRGPALVIYTCGPSRCRRKVSRQFMRSTRASRKYWRNYRRLKQDQRSLKERGQCAR